MRAILTFSVLVLAIASFNGCATINRNDYLKKVKAYLAQFEMNLAASDDLILKQFKVEKSEEAIIKDIRIMQNADKSKDSVMCNINFDNAKIVFEDIDIRVEILTEFTSLDEQIKFEKEITFTLWLGSDNGNLFINKVDADQFYSTYRECAHNLRNRKARELDIAKRKIFFDQARQLQETYDSVIWYTMYGDSIYYYVINGAWDNYFLGGKKERPVSYKMGLVSETGRIVVPPSHDLVGTIGFIKPALIEVNKNGYVGQYSIDGQELVPSIYNWIIPYEKDSLYALVKKDSVNGWLDRSYVFHNGYPDTVAEKYISEFQYLSQHINISSERTTMTEILDIEHMGSGIVMPPTYLVMNGIFQDVVYDIFTGNNALGWGGTERIETKGSFFERITSNLSSLFVLIEGRYLGGREEFYKYKDLTFIDDKGRKIGSYRTYSGENKLRQIDSTLLELKTTASAAEAMDYWDMGDEPGDWNQPQFKYFRISREENIVIPLDSKRRFAFTEHIKIDSSYLRGEFVYWDAERGEKVQRWFVSEETLQIIRNEILAINGYVFADKVLQESYQRYDWYEPRFTRYEDLLASLSEIDRHNLKFLETMIKPLPDQPAT